jgi:hypothetical protein
MERQARGQVTPDNVAAVQATVYRAEALRGAIPTDQLKGSKAPIWLSMREVKELLGCGSGTSSDVLPSSPDLMWAG